MDVLAGGDGGNRPPPPPGRRFFRRQTSLALSPSDMFLFRPPTPTYVATSWPGELCVLGSSVCLALERAGGASKVLLFCHGTSSDLGMSRRSLEVLREGLDCHVIGVEYPGYGLTADGEANEQSINAAVRVAFLHLTEMMGWPAERVVIMGRSLGSGPAARLAREFRPGALFLLAAFTGVADIAGSIVGESLASMFNLNQWNNMKEVAETASPTLVLHGLKDKVVPHTHSLDLYRASAASKKYVALLLESDHNRISWRVVCDMYAKPFMEMACPEEKNRPLGIRPADVEKLSNFDPSGKAAFILACAQAAWAQRRQQFGGGSDRGSWPDPQPYAAGAGLSATEEGEEQEERGRTKTAAMGIKNAGAGAGAVNSSFSAPPMLPSDAASLSAPSTTSSAAPARRDGYGGATAATGSVVSRSGVFAEAFTTAAERTSGHENDKEGGKGGETATSFLFRPASGKRRKSGSGEDDRSSGVGGAAACDGGGDELCGCDEGFLVEAEAGGWGVGTVREPVFQVPTEESSYSIGSNSGSGSSCSGGVKGNSDISSSSGSSSSSSSSSSGRRASRKAGGGGEGVTKLGGAAEYAIVSNEKAGGEGVDAPRTGEGAEGWSFSSWFSSKRGGVRFPGTKY
ncbi:unnamed protein product [Pylaiella littoralis]